MISKKQYQNLLDEIKGKTIAIIYIYEGENAEGFAHYDIWKSNLISCWLNAIQELQCIPYILDVRTFLFKVANNTLPPIDYVINMNAGCISLSTLALIPSICGFINIDCIPCNTSAIIAGENKSFANMIAKSSGFNIPDENISSNAFIFRPLNYGSSKGVKLCKTKEMENNIHGLTQEFIEGYDITIPFVYNPLSKSMEAFPAVFYLPDENTPSWYFNDIAKETNKGFQRIILPNVSTKLNQNILRLIEKNSIDTYCRIDMRLKTNKTIKLEDICNVELNNENAYFIEINPMPTIEIGNNFLVSYNGIEETNSFYLTKKYYKELIKNFSAHGFILSCAIILKIISKH